MATYAELLDLASSSSIVGLRKRIVMAVLVKANIVAKAATPTAAARAWAQQALQNPQQYEQNMLNYILAEYNTQTTSAITNATDAQVQTAVNAAVDTLLGA